ncbi:MAG TPA: hemolysin family protein [Myxococcaceae bacterium]|nr:hemolysin family protein [Myxococcaceae bacterium]
MVAEVGIILLLVLANGLFAGSEIAVISVRRSRMPELLASHGGKARCLEYLRTHPDRFLATVQVGITLVATLAAAFGGAAIARDLERPLRRLGLGDASEDVAFALVVAGVSYLSLVLGELVPKSLALRSAERYALAVARPMVWLSRLVQPVVWLLTTSSNLILRPFGDRTSFTEARLSAQELGQLVTEATATGEVERHSAEIATRALRFQELVASEVMVPRGRVVAIPRSASQEELRRIVLEHGHSRMPVFDRSLDDIVGYVVARDLLAFALEQRLINLEDCLLPPWFVPESIPAPQLLRQMQARHVPLAFCVDEAGSFSGLVTIEDLLEELVGEIFSESDEPTALFQREADGALRVRGDTPIRELNEAAGLNLPEGDDWSTVAGLVIARAQAIPGPGARLQLEDGTVIEVLEATPRTVLAVRVRPAAQNPAAHDRSVRA